jgi:hypothetical protein
VEPLNRTTTPIDDAEARLIDLLRAADPTTLPESRKQMSLAAILNPPRERSRRGPGLRRPAMALSVALLAGASAVAAVGAHLLVRDPAVVVAPAVPPSDEPTPAPTRINSAPVRAEPAVSPIPTPMQPTMPSAPGAPRVRWSAGARARSEGENPSALMDAVKALRQDHDPVEASRLLREYLRRYPRGSLSEEARALSVEAAVARNGPDVPSLSKEYLRLYPNGRFRKAAQHALERSDL